MSETGKLADALAKARMKFKPVVKDKTAKIESTRGKYEYKYADLAALLEATVPALCAEGLVLTQLTEWTGDHLMLRTVLLHSSGERIEATFPLPTLARAQEQASSITYARRYCASALLGVAAEDDDDGAAANEIAPRNGKPEPKEAVISKAQQQAFIDKAKLSGMPPEEIKAAIRKIAGVESSAQIPASKYEAVMEAVA